MSVAEAFDEVAGVPPLPARPADSHKGTYGRVCVVAGSRLMPGAAALAALAAYRSGAGLVTVVTDAAAVSAVAAFVPEAIFADLASLGEAPEPGFDALLAGPGIGSDAAQAIEIVRTSATPTVLDADALNHLARTRTPEGALALPRRETIVWTPHPGEFHRLTGATPRGDTERLDAARAFVGAHGGVLVLKGHRTVVASRRGFAINTTGNPGMATAGAGDVLSGILVALLGQGYDAFDAARLAAHVHGLAGDLAAERLGVTALVARDLIDHLPEAWRRVERGEPPRHHQP